MGLLSIELRGCQSLDAVALMSHAIFLLLCFRDMSSQKPDYMLIGYLVNLALSFLIAKYVPGKRWQIGFRWTLFFSITWGILMGMIMVLFSPAKTAEKPTRMIPTDKREKAFRIIVGIVAVILGIFILQSDTAKDQTISLWIISFGIGIMGWGVYISKLTAAYPVKEQNQ